MIVRKTATARAGQCRDSLEFMLSEVLILKIVNSGQITKLESELSHLIHIAR